MARPRRRIPTARVAVALGFMLSGIAFASWVVRIPDIQHRLGLSEGLLGLVLLAVAVGGLIAMPLASPLIGRFGSRSVARGAAVLLAGSVALPARVPDPISLSAVLLVLGAATSVLSVALNTQAASLERRMRRPVMAGLHALYSVGGLVGATIGGLVAGAGVSAAAHLAGAAVGLGGAALVITPRLLAPREDGSGGRARMTRPGRPLLLMGVVAFCVLFGEGAVADWSAVYLRDALNAGPAAAAAGYAAYSLMMAAGRFVGDALTLRIGAQRLVRLGASLATAGMTMALLAPHTALSVVGFALVGSGFATIYPTMLANAGRVKGSPPAGSIAVVSTMGYVGLLAGPPLIGFVAEVTTLRIGFGLVAVTSALIIWLASVVQATAAGHGRQAPRGGAMPSRLGLET